MHRGFVKLWRKSLDSPVWKNADLWRFWSWCLLKATHTPFAELVGYQCVPLEPGQFVFGRKLAARETGLSERTIRTCVVTLSKLQNVTIETTNKFSVLTIVNWELFQDAGQLATNKRPASDQLATTYKNKSTEEQKDKKGRNTSCGQPAETAVLPPQVIAVDAIVSLPLNTGEPYPVTAAKAEELAPLYPAVDVPAELRKMAGWLIGNPTHRKTRAGIMRFITAWLSKAQDKGGTSPPPGQPKANSVYQLKQIEGGQKARMLQEIRRQEHGRDTSEALAGDNTQVALEVRSPVPAKVGPCGTGRADGPLE